MIVCPLIQFGETITNEFRDTWCLPATYLILLKVRDTVNSAFLNQGCFDTIQYVNNIGLLLGTTIEEGKQFI